MKFETYDIKTGRKIKDHVTYINFGDVPQGEHCETISLLKVVKTDETTVSNLEFFLQNKGSYTDSNIGFYNNAAIDKTVTPGDNNMNTHLVVNANPVAGGAGSKPISENDYVYLDIDLALDRYFGQELLNLRLLFDYT